MEALVRKGVNDYRNAIYTVKQTEEGKVKVMVRIGTDEGCVVVNGNEIKARQTKPEVMNLYFFKTPTSV